MRLLKVRLKKSSSLKSYSFEMSISRSYAKQFQSKHRVDSTSPSLFQFTFSNGWIRNP